MESLHFNGRISAVVQDSGKRKKGNDIMCVHFFQYAV